MVEVAVQADLDRCVTVDELNLYYIALATSACLTWVPLSYYEIRYEPVRRPAVAVVVFLSIEIRLGSNQSISLIFHFLRKTAPAGAVVLTSPLVQCVYNSIPTIITTPDTAYFTTFRQSILSGIHCTVACSDINKDAIE